MLLCGADDRERKRMFARLFHACGQTQDLVLIEARGRNDGHHLRLALRERSGLVDDERVDLFHPLQRLGVLDQHPDLGAAPHTDHDRHRRRQTECAGTGDDQNRNASDQSEGETRLGPVDAPGRESHERDDDHRRHEPARHLVGQPLDRRPRTLGCGHHLHNACEHGVAADLFGAHDEAAGGIERAADDSGLHALGHRHGFSRHHGFIHRRAAFDHFPVDRNFFARTNPQQITYRNRVERHLFLAAVRVQAPRRLGGEIEQGSDCARRLFPRTQLEHLTQEDKDGDHGRGFEVDVDGAARAAKCRRKNAGQQDRNHAVKPCDADANGNQRKHIQIASDERLPAAHEERPARPQHDRRGE